MNCKEYNPLFNYSNVLFETVNLAIYIYSIITPNIDSFISSEQVGESLECLSSVHHCFDTHLKLRFGCLLISE